jgi:chromosomal replication initiation ATPase DnaA
MTPQEIIGLVAIETGIPAPAITNGKYRNAAVSLARRLVVVLISETNKHLSMQMIGEAMGTTHGSVKHHLDCAPATRATNPAYSAQLTNLQRVIPSA